MLRNRACRAKIASGKLVADFSSPRFDVVKAEVAHLGTPLLGKPLKDSGRNAPAATWPLQMACDASITATGKRRQSAIDGRTTRHQGYGLSQSCRAMTECIFGCSDRI